ncbi:MAG: MBL fold metallo-hydrolase [Clostridia bacterium]
MKYELDFIGIDEETKDADAIGIHWIENDAHTIGVYDGGFSVHGNALKNIIEKYYFTDDKKDIDFIICSHSDQDHVNGLKVLLENNTVKKLYMNRPWLYIDELYEKVNDGRITKKSLEDRLKKTYKFIDDIEALAIEKGVEIKEVFEGTVINDKITVLHPSKDMYISLIVESNKTSFLEMNSQSKTFIEIMAETVSKAIKKVYNWITESWNEESLREDVSTTLENETSVIIVGDMTDEKFLLVGDAGINALDAANNYYTGKFGSIKDDIKIYQIPHHGGRHNVNTTILNKIIGGVVEKDKIVDKTAFVCSGKNSDHPLKMVTNAFIRRGVKVFVASGHIINHYKGIPSREGWTSSKKIEFSDNVEEWEK